jgi:cytochrome c553
MQMSANGFRHAFRPILALIVCGASVGSGALTAAPPEAADARGLELFTGRLRTLLAHRCAGCHGAGTVESGFDLSTRDKLLAGGAGGPAVVPGRAKESLMYRLAARLEEPHMPEEGDPLSAEELGWLAEWIDRGAPYDRPLVSESDRGPWTDRQVPAASREFWAYRPLQNVTPPEPADPQAWCRNPVDRFILAKLQAAGLSPSRDAPPHVLLRRLTYDLTGLPPTPAEVAAFHAGADDATGDAWRRTVDDLLARPAFGERWAQHWLDVARFAESFGYEQDYDRPHAFHYRDFVIRAFNDDLPYDTFLQWQIAGDQLAPEDVEARKATGFLAAGAFPTQLTEREFESARSGELDDMVATVGTAMLGATLGCARCHDHKYDPFPQADYYRLAATFTTTIRGNVDLADPAGGGAVQVLVAGENVPKIPHNADARGFPHFYTETHFLRRGDVNQKDGIATPGVMQVLTRHADGAAHWQRSSAAGATPIPPRMALARWITDVDHGAGHLAARVIVNRLWQHHFGVGLVATPSDFGHQGDPPSHPELLDWLAAELIRGGWRLNPIHRLLVTSAAYRQASTIDAERARIDPGNRLLWRFHRRRLEGEAIRDTLLALAGTLDPTLYGRAGADETSPRRSIYLERKRSRLPLFLRVFDSPDFVSGVAVRSATTTAPQALALLNSPACRRLAETFADRVLAATDEVPSLPPPPGTSAADPAGRGPRSVRTAYAFALGRSPGASERDDALAFLTAQETAHRPLGDQAARAALVDFCHILMTLNETIHIE